VKAVEKVDLTPTASVEGDITAPRFVMADGSTVMGKVHAG
jgi:cytoskeletal protein CcmA (bactofilin family)